MNNQESNDDRHRRHLNEIFQCALRLGHSVPEELRKVMDNCIVEEDAAIGLGMFSAKVVKESEVKK